MRFRLAATLFVVGVLFLIGPRCQDPALAQSGDARQSPAADGKGDDAHSVNSLHEMFAAIKSCWIPPPRDKGRYGMEYTVRFAFKSDGELLGPVRYTFASHDAPDDVREAYRVAVDATIKRCLPLHFTKSMAGSIAGRPISIRFFDNWMLGNGTNN
jgi:hypothetical protein